MWQLNLLLCILHPHSGITQATTVPVALTTAEYLRNLYLTSLPQCFQKKLTRDFIGSDSRQRLHSYW